MIQQLFFCRAETGRKSSGHFAAPSACQRRIWLLEEGGQMTPPKASRAELQELIRRMKRRRFSAVDRAVTVATAPRCPPPAPKPPPTVNTPQPSPDFSEHVPAIEASIRFVKIGIHSKLAAHLTSHAEKDAAKLAFCVTASLFLEELEDEKYSLFAASHAHEIEAACAKIVADPIAADALSYTYAVLIMLSSWTNHDMQGVLSLTERANDLGLTIPNIVQLWGDLAIVKFYQYAADFAVRSGKVDFVHDAPLEKVAESEVEGGDSHLPDFSEDGFNALEHFISSYEDVFNAIHEEALRLFHSQKMSKAVEDGLALIISMARFRCNLRTDEQWAGGATILDTDVVTELGETSVRTLSHHNGVEVARSTVFLTSNPFSEETLVSFRWTTSGRSDLLRVHDRLVACITEKGFAPFKEAVNLIKTNHRHSLSLTMYLDSIG
jgi:hypothetical protein